MSTPTTLKGVTDIGDKHLSEIITDNLIFFLNWGFLNIGAFFNVTIPTSGQYGGDKSQLKLVKDPRFTDGRVWESFAKNWVWETNLETDNQPVDISGVYINNIFHAVNSNHYIDYNNGRVIFHSPIPTNSIVQANYSYKQIDINDGHDIPWISRPLYNFSRIDNSHYNQFGSGDFSEIADRKIQLPTIAVEVNPISETRGHSLGTGYRYANNNVLLHILSDNDGTCKKIADILADQKDKIIFMFDSNKIADSGAHPLDYRGMKRSQAINYPDMIAETGYLWNKLKFYETHSQDIQRVKDSVYYTAVKMETDVVLYNV